ncbi:MAG TPA: APC family permease, partial [Gemmatimonadales bacterium]|nr:APC family permease [Gemmatimonadales bacterium]
MPKTPPNSMHQELTCGQAEGLVRGITALGLAAGVVNVVVGGGIFVLPALLAAQIGPVGPIVHLISDGAVFLVATSYVTIGRTVSRSGGSYAYVADVLGPFTGYLAGVLTWLVGAFASAALLVALATMVALLHPSLQTTAARPALIIVLYLLPLTINLVTIHSGTRVVMALTIIKLGTLLSFLLFVFPLVEGDHLTWTAPISSAGLARAAIISFFAFGGMEMALGASGEIQSPGRTLPPAVLGGIGLVVLLYAAVQVVTQGVLGPALPDSPAPLAEAAARVHPGLHALIVVGTAISIYGALAGTL